MPLVREARPSLNKPFPLILFRIGICCFSNRFHENSSRLGKQFPLLARKHSFCTTFVRPVTFHVIVGRQNRWFGGIRMLPRLLSKRFPGRKRGGFCGCKRTKMDFVLVMFEPWTSSQFLECPCMLLNFQSYKHSNKSLRRVWVSFNRSLILNNTQKRI